MIMEFHIHRQARERYQFEDSLFSFNGRVIFANFHAARVFAQRINQTRDTAFYPDQAVDAGQINAMGLINEILHYVTFLYRQQFLPDMHNEMYAYLQENYGKRKLNSAVRQFLKSFPPPVVYQGKMRLDEYLIAETDGLSNRQSILEEMLMLRLANLNPAYESFSELFPDDALCKNKAYGSIVEFMKQFFAGKPRFGPGSQNLIDLLRSPANAVPGSLQGQLDFICSRWGDLLGHNMLKLIGSLDMILEESHSHLLGPGPMRIPVYDSHPIEKERFSPDADWMPNCVMMAKNIHVWLDKLNRRYQRPIRHLNDIPDEVLDQLSGWGFTSLWLIGLWERSSASALIKQKYGNPEALASAYALKRYSIADDLGGEEELQKLTVRAKARGIRLASDMVPNHMAIDSDLVQDHPEWFISLPYSPYPSYSFKGPNLGDIKKGELYLEDHYYDCSDAAVVFKYHSKERNQTFFIYHGNDGTNIPWNDTAQLNYLLPEVREAVIQIILEVAKRFSIIRFDAAMTLTKRHYERLWFPAPGGGSDIPSRSEFGMTQKEFNSRMPHEFWREVVDRVAAEAPDTLLLAEAFWLMEGYFVRTLGMHRVYNSAFMNMLREEENEKYRQVIKNTMEFDPEILKRFVNFMNNPDEETAANQFGNGDKYFGVCVMLATMPGMPMFGHGQIEGYQEKYGMEYRRAYVSELPDPQLIERHEQQIFPLLKKRYLFSDVKHFYLYDFYNAIGKVNENVFVYSNMANSERALIVYNNCFASTTGWARVSGAFMDKTIGAIRQTDIRGGLDLPNQEYQYVVFRDQLTGLQYIRNCKEIAEKGFFLQLDAYCSHAFLDFRIVQDTKGQWKAVCDNLGGRGTTDIDRLHAEIHILPVLQPLREIANVSYFEYLLSEKPALFDGMIPDSLLNESARKLTNLIQGMGNLLHRESKAEWIVLDFQNKILTAARLPWIIRNDSPTDLLEGDPFSWVGKAFSDGQWLILVLWLYLNGAREAFKWTSQELISTCEEFMVFKNVDLVFRNLGERCDLLVANGGTLRQLLSISGWLKRFGRRKPGNVIRTLFQMPEVRKYLLHNEYAGRKWFSKERAERLFQWMAIEAALEISNRTGQSRNRMLSRLEYARVLIYNLQTAAGKSGYDVDQFLSLLDKIGS
jgi:glycosidase